MKYDVIVVGGGHAGCEAAAAAARCGCFTALITSNLKNIADMPCNPSIGGTAKGIVVREVDALGGLMGRVADMSHLQIKMLNSSKGPAVKSLRAQGDKITYPKNMVNELKKLENLEIIEGMVEDLIVEDNSIKGVILDNGDKYYCTSLVLTTGTYLKSKILVGDTHKYEGPHGEVSSKHLSDKLRDLGLEIQRLKTGTPQRIDPTTVDYSVLTPELGDDELLAFSFDRKPDYDPKKQRKCYLVYTNEETHKIIRDNLDKSAMYGGYAEGIGPRYCPSIEDKVVRFKDKERHQLFLEPESMEINETYIQGFSTSMPHYVQEQMVHSLPGFENAKIAKYAYAIEYDAVDPLELKPTLESKKVKGLFFGGQVNGTSGYEEAAAQGLMAGMNASCLVRGKEQIVLKRDEAYLGVLIDDLVTKGVTDPYRMLTSRAEYRLLLRHDNADQRLIKYGYHTGLISEERYNNYLKKMETLKDEKERLANTRLTPKQNINDYLTSINSPILKDGISALELMKRPEISYFDIVKMANFDNPLDYELGEQVNIEVKYQGYIDKEFKEANRVLKLESVLIPEDINYQEIANLASEAREKLMRVKPRTIAQATRISGVNPSDIAILLVYIESNRKRKK